MSKAEKTKQYIVETTAPIFNMKGFAGTSIADLTEATGLTKGSIYGNFASKDEVALAAFDHNYKTISSFITAKISEKQHAADKLKVFLTVFGNFPSNHALRGGCPILNTAIEADDTHMQLRAKAINAIENWYATIESIIMDGIEKGQFKQGTDGKDFAGAFIALLEGGMMLAKVTGKMAGMKAAVKQGEKMVKEIST